MTRSNVVGQSKGWQPVLRVQSNNGLARSFGLRSERLNGVAISLPASANGLHPRDSQLRLNRDDPAGLSSVSVY